MPTPTQQTLGGVDARPYLAKPRKPKKGKRMSPLYKVRFDNGRTFKDIAKAANVGQHVITKLENGRLASNDPRAEIFAAAYGCDVALVRAALDPKFVLSDTIVRRLLRLQELPVGQRNAKRKTKDTVAKGKRIAVVKRAAVVPANGNGRHTHDVARLIPPEIRALLRSLVDTTNVSVMHGRKDISIQKVPTGEFADLLADYFHAKGIAARMVLSEDYGGVFDLKD